MAQHIPYTSGLVYTHILHDEIEADVAIAACKAQSCAGAKSIAISLTEADDGEDTVNNRQVDMTVWISLDNGTTYIQYAKLIANAVNTNSQTIAHVSTLNRSTAGTDVLFFDPETVGSITHFKVVMDVTDAAAPVGLFTVRANIKY